MLLTITTTHSPATDIGFLLEKHPEKVHEFDLSAGRALVFYPETGNAVAPRRRRLRSARCQQPEQRCQCAWRLGTRAWIPVQITPWTDLAELMGQSMEKIQKRVVFRGGRADTLAADDV